MPHHPLHQRTVAVLLLATLLMLAGCGPLSFTVGVRPEDRELDTTTVEDDQRWFGPRVAIIDISGKLVNADRNGLLEQGENPVSLLNEKLRRAREDSRVEAVILRLNTPGGTVTASDMMHRAVERFKKQTDKPVVALMMDLTTSGGYYIACAADHIVTYPTTVTGSIGVIVQTVSVEMALNRLGVQTVAITSGENKASTSLLNDLSPEQREIFETMVTDFYDRFRQTVREGRPNLTDEQFDRISDGRVLSGRRAAKLNLADEVGDLYDAFASARSLAGVESADLVVYHRQLKHVGSPYAAAQGPGPSVQNQTQINLAQVNLQGQIPGLGPAQFYYMWDPIAQQSE